MPAYRSEDEAEIRRAVVAHLRTLRPGARIMHEINACSFGNRIDVLAVDEAEIVAVEIKSRKDKLDRLPDQVTAMRGVTHNVIAAIHERFLRDSFVGVLAPEEARDAVVWVWPVAERRGHVECGIEWRDRSRWQKLIPKCLPPGAIDILWAAELREICAGLGMRGVAKLTMPVAIDEIRWRMTGEEITRAICAALRARECPEADAPIAANDNATTLVA